MTARRWLLQTLVGSSLLWKCTTAWSIPPNLDQARRNVLLTVGRTAISTTAVLVPPTPVNAAVKEAKRCTDIESCRELGEKRDQARLEENPIVRLGGGLQYKVLATGLGEDAVSKTSRVNLIYSISQANGSYMYSQGFGYNKIDAGGGKLVSDVGLDSLLVPMDSKNVVPLGIQQAIVGMKRGERRRIECPPSLGFETSDWNPQPTSFRGKQQIKDYQNKLFGRSGAPPFAAPTIWDVEIVSIR